MPRATRSWTSQERTLPQQLQRECGPAGILISDFWPPEYERTHFCCCEPSTLCHFVEQTQEMNTGPLHHTSRLLVIKIPLQHPPLERHSVRGHTVSGWQCQDFYPGVAASESHGISFSPFLQSTFPPSFVTKRAELTLPGSSLAGQTADKSRIFHVVII